MPDALTLSLVFLGAMTGFCVVMLVAICRCVFELVTLARAQESRERQRETPAASEPR